MRTRRLLCSVAVVLLAGLGWGVGGASADAATAGVTVAEMPAAPAPTASALPALPAAEALRMVARCTGIGQATPVGGDDQPGSSRSTCAAPEAPESVGLAEPSLGLADLAGTVTVTGWASLNCPPAPYRCPSPCFAFQFLQASYAGTPAVGTIQLELQFCGNPTTITANQTALGLTGTFHLDAAIGGVSGTVSGTGISDALTQTLRFDPLLNVTTGTGVFAGISGYLQAGLPDCASTGPGPAFPGLTTFAVSCATGSISPVSNCPTLVAAPHTSYTLSDGVLIGSVATFTADPGYVLRGASALTCQPTGMWSGTPPTAIAQCPVLVASPHTSFLLYWDYLAGSIAIFTADPGWVLVGESTLTCQSDGTWSDPVPTAAPGCPELVAASHTSYVLSNGQLVGSIATFTADPGFVLVGDTSLTCQSDGTWSGPVPTAIGQCPVLVAAPHTSFTLSNDYSVGSVATFTAFPGWGLVGSATLTCRSDGTWSGPAPTANALPAPVATPGVASTVEGNSGTRSLNVPVTLSNTSAETVTLQWTTLHVPGAPGDQADQIADYIPASGTVTFAPGETTKMVTLQVDGDTLVEPDEYIVVSFHDPTNASMGGFWGLGFGVITNDDHATVVPGAASVLEGDDGTTIVHVPVTLSNASVTPITVEWTTMFAVGAPDGQADPAVDYTPVSGTVTFAPGETTKTVPIVVHGDTLVEPDEYLVVSFHDPTNAVMGGFWGLGFAVITNDD